MNFTLCVLLVYYDNWSVQTHKCIMRVIALYTKCLHRPIVIINQQYIKSEIHFIYNIIYVCLDCVLSITIIKTVVFLLKFQRHAE